MSGFLRMGDELGEHSRVLHQPAQVGPLDTQSSACLHLTVLTASVSSRDTACSPLLTQSPCLASELSLEMDSVTATGTSPGRRNGGGAHCRIKIHEVQGHTGDSLRAQETHKCSPSLGLQTGVFVCQGNEVNRCHLPAHILNVE